MQIFESIKSIQAFLSVKKQQGCSIGFVPTMGALHQGHLTLIERAKTDNDVVVCSIYVNPTQFNNTFDLEKYPRNVDRDKILLENAECDVLFYPSDEIMYPEGKDDSMKLDFGALDKVLEGEFRPGHFSGVGLILSKFFHIVSADSVYFGQKDLQQCSIVQKLIDTLFFDIQLVVVPTVREKSGLAMSSRNARLSNEGKEVAANLYETLMKVREMLQNGEDLNKAKQTGINSIKKYKEIQLEYLEVVDRKSFTQATGNTSKKEIAICVAAFIEGVRLIDNVLVFS
ncbi:pantoate--beta-alanine ligase [Catalinimonas niigatensis]|uniref:pantoate--beta-alanine ligase n=1 Tax=Catalinimonas niigatensis TaxID=1397264 RepID=UPI002665607A|nr:pantoate--beta-alanine ligase [Catalinimonas niigatensis]WPP48213.1 pantoate--beta-alanine ligase [Catalinimonas niigatensis]